MIATLAQKMDHTSFNVEVFFSNQDWLKVFQRKKSSCRGRSGIHLLGNVLAKRARRASECFERGRETAEPKSDHILEVSATNNFFVQCRGKEGDRERN